MSEIRYPLQPYERIKLVARSRIFAGLTPAAAEALTGTHALTFGVGTTSLVGDGSLAGSCALAFGHGASALGGAVPAEGTCALTFGATAALGSGGAMAGACALTFGQTSALEAAGVLAGVTALVFGEGDSTLSGEIETLPLPILVMAPRLAV